ncbi:MAG: CinA family protein [Ruminococcus sp.]|nr:CinA family protein [Ruminococcus sp.]
MNKYYEFVTETIDKAAGRVVKYMHERGLSLSAAESCTGGLLSAAVTSVPGASAVFVGGAVTYSAEMKIAMIGVSSETIKTFSVYSHETAREMAAGICSVTGADIGVGITGIAGPGGGTAEMPVGTVFVAVSVKGDVKSKELKLYEETGGSVPDRRMVRELAVLRSLEWLLELLGAEKEVGRQCQ